VIPVCRLYEEAVLRDPQHLLLPLLLSGALTAFVLAVEWYVALRPDRRQSFKQHQSIPKGAPR
jgi:hypothetical protein